MAVIDYTTNVGKVRLRIGDSLDLQIFPDSIYEDVLTANSDNVTATAREMAFMILAQLTQNTRSRLDRIETYGQQAFDNYLKFIEKYITSANSPNNLAGIYAAGISITDIDSNQTDPDVVQRRMPWGPNGEYSPITNPFDCDSSSF